MYEIRSILLSHEEIAATASLLRRVVENSDYTEQFLNWQYVQNPDGRAVGFNAYAENGELAAHYVCQPIRAMQNGKNTRGLLSMNSVTHPNHRGKGLFVQLAGATYERAAALGYEFVIGVANQNSTHGFIRRLGFELVTPLQAKVGLGSVHLSRSTEGVSYYRIWTEDSLRWRLNNPNRVYRIANDQIYADTNKFGLMAVLGNIEGKGKNEDIRSGKVFLGLDPYARFRGPFFDLPVKFRPSPLNLIFKDLTETEMKLDPDSIRFWCIDFDAY